MLEKLNAMTAGMFRSTYCHIAYVSLLHHVSKVSRETCFLSFLRDLVPYIGSTTSSSYTDLLPGSPDDYSKSTKALLLDYARQPSMASLFNHASMAHNNHFFFSTLTTEKQEMPLNLQKNVEDNFSSVETLKQDFIATANAMFGPGFVWLVRTDDGIDRKRLALLTTYIAGSPYPGAHFRRQERDMNTEMDLKNPADASRQRALANMPVSNTVGSHGPLSPKKIAPGGIGVIPLLCVNTWEHVYLADWGILGKKQFLEAWWDRIDWNIVANRHVESSDKRRF